MSDWKPIDTAPKEHGKLVLLANAEHVWPGRWHVDKGEILIAADKPYWEPFDDSGWQFESGLDVGWFEPTHWMPFPAPPEPA